MGPWAVFNVFEGDQGIDLDGDGELSLVFPFALNLSTSSVFKLPYPARVPGLPGIVGDAVFDWSPDGRSVAITDLEARETTYHERPSRDDD